MNSYTVDYFIKKFEDIPANLWIMGSRSLVDTNGGPTQHCALGFCDQHEEASLVFLFAAKIGLSVAWINDGYNNYYVTDKMQNSNENNPKQRILAALEMIKEKQAVESKMYKTK